MKREPDIHKIFRDGKLIQRALAEAARSAIEQHRRSGLPVVIWRDGKVAWVPAEELLPKKNGRKRKKKSGHAR